MTLRRLLPLLILPLALAACDGARMPWEEAAPEVPAVTGPPAVSPLENPIEVAGAPRVAVATAEARTLNETAFVVEGPGNAWRVEVAGDRARYLRPGAREAAVTVRRLVYARGVEYVGRLGDAPFALTVLGDPCKIAGMERAWPLTARLKAGGRTVEGCAAPAAGAPARTFTVAPPAPARSAAPAAKAPTPAPAPAPAPAPQPAPTPTPTPTPAEPAAPTPDPVPTEPAVIPAPEPAQTAPETPEPTTAPAAEPAPATPPVILPAPTPATDSAPAATTEG